MATLTTLPKRAVKQGLVIHKIAERRATTCNTAPSSSPTCVAAEYLQSARGRRTYRPGPSEALRSVRSVDTLVVVNGSRKLTP